MVMLTTVKADNKKVLESIPDSGLNQKQDNNEEEEQKNEACVAGLKRGCLKLDAVRHDFGNICQVVVGSCPGLGYDVKDCGVQVDKIEGGGFHVVIQLLVER